VSLELEQDVVRELEAAKTIRDGGQRAKALSDLFTLLPDYLLGRALHFIWSIEDPKDRAVALAAMAPRLPKSLLSEAVSGAKAIGDLKQRAEAIVRLALYLTGDSKEKALDQVIVLADKLGSGIDRSILLVNVSSQLQAAREPEVIAKSFCALIQSSDLNIFDKFISSTGQHLLSSDLPEIVNVVLTIPNERSRSLAIISLIPLLPIGLLSYVTDSVCLMRDEVARNDALVALFPILPKELLFSSLGAKRSHSIKGAVWRMVFPDDESERVHKALNNTKGLPNDFYRTAALAALAPHLPMTLMHEAIDITRAIEDDLDRVVAMAALTSRLPAVEGQRYFVEILSDASAIVVEHHRVSALVRMIQYLTPEQRDQALQVAIEALGPIGDPLYRAAALGKLAPHLPQKMFDQAITAALDIRDETERASALATLALYSPPELCLRGFVFQGS
jgi:hypothetical protein